MRILLSGLFGLLLSWSIFLKDPMDPPTEEPAILVALQEGYSLAQILTDLTIQLRSGDEQRFEQLYPNEPYYLVFVDRNNQQEQLTRLQQHPGIRMAQFNHAVRERNTDPYWEEQWNLRRIGLPEVWSVPRPQPDSRSTTSHILIGVLEKNGFDLQHADLNGQFWSNPYEIPYDGLDNDANGFVDDIQGWNFRTQSAIHQLDQHGTQVAGLIGARSGNRLGIAGIHQGAGLIPLSGLHYEHQIVRAYLYLRDLRRRYNRSEGREGALVVAANASFGVNFGRPEDYPIWCEVFDKLGKEGILSVSSVMNAPINIDQYSDIPTSCGSDYLITVTESDIQDQLPADAAYGLQKVDLAAPGRGSFTTFAYDRYGTVNRGTSFAAPHVSGTIAVLYDYFCADLQEKLLADPAGTARLVKQWILDGVTPVTTLTNKVKSGGRLNASASLHLLNTYCPKTDHPVFHHPQRVFPNPFPDELYIQLTVPATDLFTFRVFDLQGRLLFLKKRRIPQSEQYTQTLNLSTLPPGVYQLIISGGGRQMTHRIVKMP